MLGKLKQAGAMAKAVRDLKRMQKAMEEQKITVEEDNIKIIVNGAMKIISVEIDGVENKKLVDVLNKAVKKAQQQSAEMMKQMGDLGQIFQGISG